MRTKYLLSGLAVAVLAALPALAQDRPNPAAPPTAAQLEQRVEQSQKNLLAAQAEFYLATAQKLQHLLNEQAAQSAATSRWWDSWWKGMFGEKSAPPAPEAGQK